MFKTTNAGFRLRLICTLSLAVALTTGCIRAHKKILYVPSYSVQTIRTEEGWGYDICVHNKIYIHQEYVPVIAQREGFPSKDIARRCALIVVDKLEKGKSPTLTAEDLIDAGVSVPDSLLSKPNP